MIKHFTFNHFGVNCYLIVDEVAKQCAIVDPAMEATYEDAQLTQYLSTESLQVTHILLTHAHVDHIAGLRQACERFKLPVTMHRDGTLRGRVALKRRLHPRRRVCQSPRAPGHLLRVRVEAGGARCASG